MDYIKYNWLSECVAENRKQKHSPQFESKTMETGSDIRHKKCVSSVFLQNTNSTICSHMLLLVMSAYH